MSRLIRVFDFLNWGLLISAVVLILQVDLNFIVCALLSATALLTRTHGRSQTGRVSGTFYFLATVALQAISVAMGVLVIKSL